MQSYGGISRYFFELMKQFKENRKVEFDIGVKFSNNEYLRNFKAHSITPFFPNTNFTGKGRIVYKYNQFITDILLRKNSYDLVHPTYYDAAIVPKLRKTPFVLTCHDLIHEYYKGKYTGLGDVDLNQKKKLIEQAAAIIAVSENTKKDIIAFYNLSPDKIKVTHLASSLNIADIRKPQDNQLPEQYLLYVGNRSLYKNFESYLKAICPLMSASPDLKLICAGGGAFTKEEQSLIKNYRLGEQVKQVSVNDSFLAVLYKYALAFVFPSLYEGFGIPTLEAFSCGCPVLLSNSSSLPEVGSDAALYFDPTSAESMLQATKEIIDNKTLRDTLSVKGTERSKQFSWETTAQLTYEVYKAIA
ncbi:glycosyltransferase family 1 protein [uncultured Pontibacter sp.]|uniref:glycosyltransferase family 4 protein n=1 Tax=uncultured Pontibacter sp. TaxID=453356 RepID=UPI002611C859|nr:glycosyltransferase family 1 protein [uncultured Pontibacter sp.]